MNPRRCFLIVLVLVLVFGAALYFTDDPDSAEFWGTIRMDRRHMGKPCDAWVYAKPVDMNELDKVITKLAPGDTIVINIDGAILGHGFIDIALRCECENELKLSYLIDVVTWPIEIFCGGCYAKYTLSREVAK